MNGATIFRVFTEAGDASADDSLRIVDAGSDAVLQLGWAVARQAGPATEAPIVVDLIPGMIMPAVARQVAEWLAGCGRTRVTIATGSSNGGGRIEFLGATIAAAWLQRLADAAVARSDDAAPGAVRALAATWLDAEGRHVPSLAAMGMRRDDPDAALFALHSIGCIALRWAPRVVLAGGNVPGRVVMFDAKGYAGIPSCVMLDPRSLRKASAAALAQRIAGFPAHSISLEWFDGTTWQMEMEIGATISGRIEALRRMLQEPGVPPGLTAVEVEPGFLMRAAERGTDAAVALRIQAEWRAAGGPGADLGPLAEGWSELLAGPGVRAKLLRSDMDGGMTFLRYSDGGRCFYSREGDESVLIGRRLDAIPNQRLADQIVRTTRRLRGEADPVLERISGRACTIFDAEIRIDYWRLSLPVGADGRRIQGSLVMTGGFQVARAGLSA